MCLYDHFSTAVVKTKYVVTGNQRSIKDVLIESILKFVFVTGSIIEESFLYTKSTCRAQSTIQDETFCENSYGR